MRAFRFNLQKVLELRSHREREKEIALGRALGALHQIERSLAELGEERFQAASERFSLAHGAEEILVFDLYIRRLDETRERFLREAAMAELKVAEAREEYLEAARDCKALEKLKERRLTEYRKARRLEETKNLDDISRRAPGPGGVLAEGIGAQ
jgi:flagellar FliJ protein